jgi:hypothetical protein
MRRIHSSLKQCVTGGILAVSLAIGLNAGLLAADQANAPSLVISQLKMTSSNGQFVTLYNPGPAALDMSKYQLEYFNNYDLSKATSSKLIGLTGSLPPHSYYVVNDSLLPICYQITIDSISLGLSTTAGMLAVLSTAQSSAGGSITPSLQDYIAWTKTAASGTQTLPSSTDAFLQRLPLDASNNPSVTIAGSGTWQTVQPDPSDSCKLVHPVSGGSTPANLGLNTLRPGSQPPASIITVQDESDSVAATLPIGDIGLTSPQLNELLPNPAGTGNDDTDEFIEIYNPNSTGFDLTGFSLQVGTVSQHTYHFSGGTLLPPKSFTAFYSADTGLSLSNAGGQAKLLDPFSNTISFADVYTTAKDGQSWSLAKGKWYWTSSVTPGAANIIKQAVTKKKATSKTSVKSGSVKGTSTAKGSKTKLQNDGLTSSTADAPKTAIHPAVLALVFSLAVLYGAYEYRSDLANKFYEFRRYLAARRAARATLARRRSN